MAASGSAATPLLRASLAHIPTHGFSMAAVCKAIETDGALLGTTQAAQPAERDRALDALFPGPDSAPTSAPLRLFYTWDNEARKATIQARDPHPPTREAAFQDAVGQLESRLEASDAVRGHLLRGLALYASYPIARLPGGGPVPGLGASLEKLGLSGSIPDPFPLAYRAMNLAVDACSASGVEGEHGTEWYKARTRLALGYGLAEVCLAAQPTLTLESSRALLRTMAEKPAADAYATAGLQSVQQWIAWGGRGWLGILRSVGL